MRVAGPKAAWPGRLSKWAPWPRRAKGYSKGAPAVRNGAHAPAGTARLTFVTPARTGPGGAARRSGGPGARSRGGRLICTARASRSTRPERGCEAVNPIVKRSPGNEARTAARPRDCAKDVLTGVPALTALHSNVQSASGKTPVEQSMIRPFT